jgi:hypothetical protein
MLIEAGILPKKERAGLSFGSFFLGARDWGLGARKKIGILNADSQR